jgi:predicted sugar kinase
MVVTVTPPVRVVEGMGVMAVDRVVGRVPGGIAVTLRQPRTVIGMKCAVGAGTTCPGAGDKKTEGKRGDDERGTPHVPKYA